MTSAALEPKELGTLVVVVGKAKNLVNKSRFGKQDPFCTVAIGEEKQRTKPIKRGGQHPEWDEELRFAIVEDLDDVLVRSESQPDSLNSSLNGAPPPPLKDPPSGVITSAALASKSRKGPINKKGGKSMKVACYADDAKEPEMIGDCVVNIDEVLKKGEVDEWYNINYKDKYSGEIYLELTFFSNDAPPVKRNVPRPSVHNYGGAGTFSASPSGTLASAASRTKLNGSLTASGSVSGMSLYIPPYAQQGRAPSPSPSVNPPLAPGQPPIPASNSFADLGLPPGHRMSQGIPAPPTHPSQPAYPPTQPSLLSHESQSSIDALTRPMSSMSIGSAYPAQPSVPTPGIPPSASAQQHAYANHRHSIGGGSSDAPWAQRLPQNQPLSSAPTPLPRPMSTSDSLPWEHTQRLEQERLQAGATPIPRPTSGQSYGQLNGQLPSAPSQVGFGGHRIPSTIPESLRPGGPPQQDQYNPPRAHSFSTATPAPGPLQSQHPYAPPTPAPPPPSHSAPPISPSTSTRYQMPTTSFSTLTQPVHDPHRAASPAIPQYAPTNGSYHDRTAPLPPIAQQTYHTPTRSSTYSPRPPVQEYQHTPPPAQTYSPAHSQINQSTYQATPPPAQPTSQYAQNVPVAQTANDNGYVPWYQQTQSARVQSTPPQSSYQQSPYAPDASQPQYGQLPPSASTYAPPPVPQSRPQPPAPPSRPSVGYYPSDELYARDRQSDQTPQPAQAPWQQSHQTRQSYDQNAFDTRRQQAISPIQSSPYSPPAPQQQQQQPGYQGMPAPSDPGPQSWQASQPPYTSPQNGTSTYYPQPPPLQNSYGNSPQPLQNDYRASSPQPPPNDYHRAASPYPYGNTPSQIGYGRSSSPQPPVNQYQDQNQNQYQYPPPPQAQHSAANPLVDAGRAPSPAPPQAAVARQDWRSYMSSLTTTGSGGGIIPARTPSPQPPPKDSTSHQQQQQWYTPPPNLPTSIVPPEGWKSTLPAQKDGHAWRG
ncbi:uncharacterized protein I303_106105 [Kwoniella dejecticola CBS 10117]|uniref:C2 domain-containing protein n=1 Tax=Kwoniella dejecticola CBS 10117 TaxID=1296121 RepID=A0A1A6A1A6_9TREE|nr:uncharacterized protein I303_06124 [Kwoniella dejecticola CBS 10117]OBR83841.1 hypothetical protein I303_06124 [Kwoniella dejecticola CBS 10117]